MGVVYGDFDEGENVVNVRKALSPKQVFLLNGGAGDAAITSVTIEVFDLQGADPDIAIWTSGSIATSSVFKSSLTVDGYWDEDAEGYNLFHQQAATDFVHVGGHDYLWHYYVVTPASTVPLRFSIQKHCIPAVGV